MAEVAPLNHHGPRAKFGPSQGGARRAPEFALRWRRAYGAGGVGPHQGAAGRARCSSIPGRIQRRMGRLPMSPPRRGGGPEPVLSSSGFSLQQVLAAGEPLAASRIQPVLVGVQLALTELGAATRPMR